MEYSEITKQVREAVTALLDAANLEAGDIFVVGCSSSEIVGGEIGHASSPDAAAAVLDGVLPVLREKGIYLAAQCCEHLNRALIVERACAKVHGYEPVCVVPKPKAGGSFATAAWGAFDSPVAVEHVKANAGIDIGGTLIGMHLRDVAVPFHFASGHIGNATLLGARTRPKYIGGERAKYE